MKEIMRYICDVRDEMNLIFGTLLYLWPANTSVTSITNDKGGHEMIPGVVHRPPGICLTAEENLEKSQLRDCR